MNEEVQFIFDSAEEAMKKAIEHLETELNKIRAGKANPSMLESVKVNYYGAVTPLQQVANINTPDPKTIIVQPWEKGLLEEISNAILVANLGFAPANNGEVLIISIPPLTEDRRREMVKKARAEAEHAKVGLRNSRKDANTEIKQLEKDGLSEDEARKAEDAVQDLTNKYVLRCDQIVDGKEKDIMTV
jgi:ribosome recycling factor